MLAGSEGPVSSGRQTGVCRGFATQVGRPEVGLHATRAVGPEIEGYWSEQVVAKGILSEKDLEKYLEQ
jgi:hypothetical protein